ncbi:MAG: 23S rRNA (pseudouridine(1915)-N(3))-methyltransferase RlmH [Candidatus Magasanikbacteria bacterium]|nr:23S rRNA (pseudouridine(1915)-N(3))-methyltransferase RlmH [Candidatus Magasanikbacteria bacterium]
MNIKVVVVGKFKEKYWLEAETEYKKRLTPYAKISVLELPDTAFKNEGDRERIRTLESEKIKNAIPENAFIIALTETGKKFDSIVLAKWLDDVSQSGQQLVFVIGGPLGLDRTFLKSVPATLSLSDLTFPHQLARVVLIEQLYRAATINSGKQYHY